MILSSRMLVAHAVRKQEELQEILALQKLYLRGITSPEEEKEQGFLTVIHDFETLTRMQGIEASVIVKDHETLAGYALVMARACADLIPVLKPMFYHFEHISYQNKAIGDYSFYVMGQICVAKPFRGLGVFDMLYHEHRNLYQDKYDFVVTEISTRNLRSLRAHERLGFREIYQFRDEMDEWSVVLWDWS